MYVRGRGWRSFLRGGLEKYTFLSSGAGTAGRSEGHRRASQDHRSRRSSTDAAFAAAFAEVAVLAAAVTSATAAAATATAATAAAAASDAVADTAAAASAPQLQPHPLDLAAWSHLVAVVGPQHNNHVVPLRAEQCLQLL